MQQRLDLVVYCSGGACPFFGTLKCSGCELRHYCSRKCQKKEWPQHKDQCHYEKPAQARLCWQCDALDPMKYSTVANKRSAAQERAALVSLAVSQHMATVIALECYTAEMTDKKMNTMLDDLRNTPLPPSDPLWPPPQSHRAALRLFWAMLLERHSGADAHALVAMAQYYSQEESDVYFANNNTCSVASFPVSTGLEYTVFHTPLESFGSMWAQDIQRRIRNLAYLFIFLPLDGTAHYALAHTAMLRVVNKSAFWLQACYGYYDVATWLAFDTDLQQQPLADDDWPRQPLCARPKWRRPLRLDDVTAMARDIDALHTNQTPDPLLYANLTGILFDTVPKMRLLIFRQCV